MGNTFSGGGEVDKGMNWLSDPLDLSGERASDKAIGAQQGASDKADRTLRYMFETQRADLAPWRVAGTKALTGMEDADFSRDFKMSDFFCFGSSSN